jgi:hypothetical protein
LKTLKRRSGIDNKEVVHRLGDNTEHLLVPGLVDNKVILQNRRIYTSGVWGVIEVMMDLNIKW